MPAMSTFYQRVFALVVAAVLGYALVKIFTPFFGAMAWAAFLAFLLLPLNVRWRRHLRGNGVTAGVLTILAPITILLPLSALSIDFVTQISELVRKLQKAAAQWDIKTFTDMCIQEIGEGRVTALGKEWQRYDFEADTVVNALGYEPDTSLADELDGVVRRLYRIGDCVRPRNILHAVHEAAYAA
ncbi:MAG: hypothetical protein ABSG18_03325, partial [Steroidobacteraceae bacterium]